MNYLAHFHLAGTNPALIVGGFLGDYVKGPLTQQYSAAIVAGIQLHRNIDQYSNTHSVQQTVNQLLPSHWRRYNGIIYDVVCDHFLSNHWHRYDQRKLADYATNIYQTLGQHQALMPSKAANFYQRMHSYNLLCAYKNRSTVEKTLASIGTRLKSANPLAELSTQLWQYQPQLEESFHTFYTQLLSYAQQQQQELTQHL